ncbi:hypothetical protein Bca4012_089035 [Brassica carinata]|uniref:Uncharacterized protein n=2 Tax=Brassica TaxID=3705 RepID=A0A8X7PAT4_BRACI|nr:hypothetical protein Bca52824_087403 [Brassica carinata]VDD50650.1 unnamed protein product [Brassica oleracea]
MKLVVLMSFLLLLIACSSGFEEDGVIHTDQYSVNKVQETIPRMTDYEEPGPNPGHDPTKPSYGRPPPPPKIN